MNDHPNAALVRSWLDSMAAYDMEGAAAMIADDIEWHEIGRKDAIHGKAALEERFGVGSGGGTRPDYEISGETHDVIANDDHTIALISAHAKRGDQTLDYKVAEIYHIKDGKITQRWAFSDDTEAINNFFGGR